MQQPAATKSPQTQTKTGAVALLLRFSIYQRIADLIKRYIKYHRDEIQAKQLKLF